MIFNRHFKSFIDGKKKRKEKIKDLQDLKLTKILFMY